MHYLILCSSQLCLHKEPPHYQSHPLRKSKVRLETQQIVAAYRFSEKLAYHSSCMITGSKWFRLQLLVDMYVLVVWLYIHQWVSINIERAIYYLPIKKIALSRKNTRNIVLRNQIAFTNNKYLVIYKYIISFRLSWCSSIGRATDL